jgi:Ca2+-binding EF-hand superfamily protein
MVPRSDSSRKLSEAMLVPYKKFLDQYEIKTDAKLAKTVKHQQDKVITQLVGKILSKENDLKRSFDKHDTEKTGKLSYWQFSQMLQELDMGLSSRTVYDFISSVDTNKDGAIDWEEFHARFSKQFTKLLKEKEHVASSPVSTPTTKASTIPSTSKALRQLAKKVFQSPTNHKGAARIAFIAADSDGNGGLSLKEFQGLLRAYDIHWPVELESKVFKFMDYNKRFVNLFSLPMPHTFPIRLTCPFWF